jgi:hypothetical protein
MELIATVVSILRCREYTQANLCNETPKSLSIFVFATERPRSNILNFSRSTLDYTSRVNSLTRVLMCESRTPKKWTDKTDKYARPALVSEITIYLRPNQLIQMLALRSSNNSRSVKLLLLSDEDGILLLGLSGVVSAFQL